MGPPTTAQRIEQLEKKVASIKETMAEMVANAVETAIHSMKQSLTELLKEGQATAVRKQGEDLKSLAPRLEGRINQTREVQEQMITSIQNEQLKFHSELRSTVT